MAALGAGAAPLADPAVLSLMDAIAPAVGTAPLPATDPMGAAVAPPVAGPVPADNLAGAPAPAFPSMDPEMIQMFLAQMFAQQASDQADLAAAQQEALVTNPLFLQMLGLMPPPGAGLDGQAGGTLQQMPSEQTVLGM